MTERRWIRCAYRKTEAVGKCERCNNRFEYLKVWKPKRFCPTCARIRHLTQMREKGAEYRRLHKIRLAGKR